MKHIILTSILLFSTAVFAQRDPDHRRAWQRLDGGVEPGKQTQTTSEQPATRTIQGNQMDPDHWQRRGYLRFDNYTYQSTHSDRPKFYTISTSKQIKLCIYGDNFMRIKTPHGEQVFNFTLHESQIVTISNTHIQIEVKDDGSWEPVNEKQAYLFEEIECE